MKCKWQTVVLPNHLAFLFLYVTFKTDYGVSMVTGLPYSIFYIFFLSEPFGLCCVGVWCYRCKRHDRVLWKLFGRRCLTHELDPKFICCSVHEQKACEKGRDWGKKRGKEREGEREREGYSSYNAVGASSYSEFTLGSHTWCKWTIKLGLTWLSLPRGPGNEPSQPAMLGGLFCTLWIPTVAGFGWGEKNKSIRKLRQLKKVNQSFHTQFRHVTNVPFLHLTLWAWQ